MLCSPVMASEDDRLDGFCVSSVLYVCPWWPLTIRLKIQHIHESHSPSLLHAWCQSVITVGFILWSYVLVNVHESYLIRADQLQLPFVAFIRGRCQTDSPDEFEICVAKLNYIWRSRAKLKLTFKHIRSCINNLRLSPYYCSFLYQPPS